MGVLTTQEMVDEVRGRLGNRTALDVSNAQVVRWLNWALLSVSTPRIYQHRELEELTTQALVAGTRDYSTNPAAGRPTFAVHAVRIFDPANVSNGIRLQPLRDRDEFERRTVPDSRPSFYSIFGPTNISLSPAPSATYGGWTLEIRRVRQPVLLDGAALGAVAELSEHWDEVLVQGATWRGWRHFKEIDRSLEAKTEFGQLINEITARVTWEALDDDYGAEVFVEGYQEGDLY